MDLFEKVKDYKGLDEKVNKLDKEIREELLTKFVNLRYQMNEIEVGYQRCEEDQVDKIKVYYPILDLAEGFSKSDEKFFRKYANEVVHKYTLTNNEGKKVQVAEIAAFETIIYENHKIAVIVKPNIVSGQITYKINISELDYNVSRKFTYQEMIEQVVESKDTILIHEANSTVFDEEQKSYEEYLKALGKTEGIITLKELVEFPQDEIQITPTLFAEIYIKKEEKNTRLCYHSSKVQVRVKNEPYILSVIEIHPKTRDGVSLGSKKFRYWELNKEFKNKMTLSEVFQLIEE